MYAQHGAALPLTKYAGDEPLKDIPVQHGMWGALSSTLRSTSPGPKTRRSHFTVILNRATHPALSCGTSAVGPRSPQPGSAWLSPPELLLAPLPPEKQNQETSASIPPGPGCSSSFLRCCQSHSEPKPSAGKAGRHHSEGGLMQQPLEIHLKSHLVAVPSLGFHSP